MHVLFYIIILYRSNIFYNAHEKQSCSGPCMVLHVLTIGHKAAQYLLSSLVGGYRSQLTHAHLVIKPCSTYTILPTWQNKVVDG